ncbi:acyltransferase family protein [Sphingomonas oryzagri]|uniref:Acyltransferase family protein n=1 Tax=Sphingomonas oryzagri TaxID=3042314 RepID=A0ABT6MXQ4_9SPHN|nr:acyltransferase family protein [Sphingomonas oryzagri]MDH7637264.1 acyltransferase family protein [Sphingomonas oryzagri]
MTIATSAGTAVSAKPARVEWIDSLRGIGIVLVVIGHVTSRPWLHHYIYLFHMPLFFAISGYVFKRTDPKALVGRRVMTLLVPYAAYLVLITGFDWLFCAFDGLKPSLPLKPLIVIGKFAIGGNFLHDTLTVAWFITSLFFANLLYAALAWRLHGATTRWMTLIALAMLVLSYLTPPIRTPWAISQVPLAFFFFWAGAAYRERGTEPWWVVLPALAIAIASMAYAPDFDMKYMTYGSIWLNVPAALSVSYLLLRLARALGPVEPATRFCASIGQAALVIMFVHKLVQIHLQPFMPDWPIMLIALVLSYAIYWAATKSAFTRTWLLGQGRVPDWMPWQGKTPATAPSGR